MIKKLKICLMFILITALSITLVSCATSYKKYEKDVASIFENYGYPGQITSISSAIEHNDVFRLTEEQKRRFEISDNQIKNSTIEAVLSLDISKLDLDEERILEGFLYKTQDDDRLFAWIGIDLGNYILRLPITSNYQDIKKEIDRFESIASIYDFTDYIGYDIIYDSDLDIAYDLLIKEIYDYDYDDEEYFETDASIVKVIESEPGGLFPDMNRLSQDFGFKPYEATSEDKFYSLYLPNLLPDFSRIIQIGMRNNQPIAAVLLINWQESYSKSDFKAMQIDSSDSAIKDVLLEMGYENSIYFDEDFFYGDESFDSMNPWYMGEDEEDSEDKTCGPVIPIPEDDQVIYPDNESEINEILADDPQYIGAMDEKELENYNEIKEKTELIDEIEDDKN